MKKIKVGIIGCGTIGGELAAACQSELKNIIHLAGVCDRDKEKALSLQRSLKKKVPILDLEDIFKKSDLIAEAASASAAAHILKKAIENKKGVMIMSVGGLIGNEGLLEKAENASVKVYIPSGALSGIDGLKSASTGRIRSVTLTTRKPPKGLEGAPYLKENKINISDVKGETVVFDGTASQAVKGFPQNVNVCAALSFAGLGPDKTRVRIITSPDYTKNIHEVEIDGDSGRISTRTENVPSERNPKTSQLAVFSAIATLKGIVNNIHVGT